MIYNYNDLQLYFLNFKFHNIYITTILLMVKFITLTNQGYLEYTFNC